MNLFIYLSIYQFNYLSISVAKSSISIENPSISIENLSINQLK